MEQFYLYIAIILSAIIIMMLSIAVVYYRRKLNKCKTALVRCINENIEMREKTSRIRTSPFYRQGRHHT